MTPSKQYEGVFSVEITPSKQYDGFFSVEITPSKQYDGVFSVEIISDLRIVVIVIVGCSITRLVDYSITLTTATTG
jgi:hypothetical protein